MRSKFVARRFAGCIKDQTMQCWWQVYNPGWRRLACLSTSRKIGDKRQRLTPRRLQALKLIQMKRESKDLQPK